MPVKIAPERCVDTVAEAAGHSSDQADVAVHANCPLASVMAGTLMTFAVGYT